MTSAPSTYAVTDPATGDVLATYPSATPAELTAAVDTSHDAYLAWRRMPLTHRAAVLARAATIFEERAAELATIMSREMGKRTPEALWEVSIVADIFRYYAEDGPAMLRDEEIVPRSGGRAVIQRRPVGVLLGIMPWNYPLYQLARFVAPNLLLGNTMVIKHAASCPESAEAFARVLADAGLLPGGCANVFANVSDIEVLIADPRVQGVSLTGSERAGSAVAEIAGRHLTKVVLELGGSDPLLVLSTDDVAATAATVFASRMGNSGQACNSPKRLIVVAEYYDEFVDQLTALSSALVPGDPQLAATTLAPLSSEAALAGVLGQVDRARDQGATVRSGGRRLDGPGAFMAPAVITDVTPAMDLYAEECFGPVLVVYRAETETEAIVIANASPYGLGASIFLTDTSRAEEISEQLDCGMVFINRAPGTEADLPFGGVKLSGFGRELGPWGMDEFTNLKLIRF